MPLVSVIIPTYGEPRFLRKAIQSVLSQTFTDLELIVVDDNNPDTSYRSSTQEIINSFVDSRLKYIKHPSNMNGATARNTGIKASVGRYVSFLDSDDEYFPNRIEKCLEEIEKTDYRTAGVYTGCEFRRNGKVYNRITDIQSGNFLKETLACSFMFCSGSNIFVKREIIDELNGFDEAFERHQDYEFLVRVFKKYDLKAIRELLIVKNNENFNLPRLDRQIAIKKQYFNKFSKEISAFPVSDRNYIINQNIVSIAENALKQKKYSFAFKCYKKTFQYSRLSGRQMIRAFAIGLVSLFKSDFR